MSSKQKYVYEQVTQLIHQHHMVNPGDRVLVGVSGGVDSVVLLHVLNGLRKKLGIDLHIAHLNHQFRGEEAERDADFVRHLAQEFHIPCTVESYDVPAVIHEQKLSPQDAARQVRYRFFTVVANDTKSDKIATAHHADDQAETVIMGLIRGVGLHGLGGIQPVLHGQIIRPLLSTSRADIEAFAKAEQVDYVTDSSNTSRKYLRNAIRLDLLPLLRERFTPAIVTRLTRYAQIFQEDAFFIDKIAARQYTQICQTIGEGVRIDIDLFAHQDTTIQRALIYKAFESLTSSRHELETLHVRAVIELFTRKTAGKQLSLPKKIVASRSYVWGYLQRKSEQAPSRRVPSPITVFVPGKTIFGDAMIETEMLTMEAAGAYIHQDRNTPGLAVEFFDYDAISGPITARFRRPGDHIRPLGMQGKKRVKKFFIDRKVPRNKRHIIPLLADMQGIFWIVGYGIDERVKLSPYTTTVLCCRLYREQHYNNNTQDET